MVFSAARETGGHHPGAGECTEALRPATVDTSRPFPSFSASLGQSFQDGEEALT